MKATNIGAQRLDAWIRTGGRKVAWIAQQIGSTPPTVSAWRTGRHAPLSQEARDALERLTGGAVRASDWP